MGKLAWAVISVALAYSLNLLLRPQLGDLYAIVDDTQATGTLKLHLAGDSPTIGVSTVAVITREITHHGRRLPLRELCVREATAAAASPLLDLCFGVPAVVSQKLASDVRALQGVELPLLAAGMLGQRESFVMVGGARSRGVVEGSLLWSSILRGEGGAVDARGRIEAQLATDQGPELLTGQLQAQLVIAR